MHKKTAKSHRLTDNRSGKEGGHSSGRMTVLQQQQRWRTNGSARATHSTSKSRSSASWDRLTEQGSWSEDALEGAASRRLLEHWWLVERTLYDEEEQLQLGPLSDECLQWRNQLPHLRISGQGLLEPDHSERRSTATSSKASSSPRRREKSAQRSERDDEIDFHQDLFSREPSIFGSAQPDHRKAREEVLDHIVDYICKELAEIEAEKRAEAELSDNFDEFLKIAPAPTTTGKNPLASNNFYYNVESVDSPARREEKERVVERQTGRNKLGTVFSERVIVSPVPYVVTTRESFCTLRKTPIQYRLGDVLDVPTIRPGSRLENKSRKLSLARKTPLIAAPHVQSSWNTPVCPTIWPKNVKLTPIDTSRLPSSKRRPTKTADSIVPSRRSRNSLSPISRSVQPGSPHNRRHHHHHHHNGMNGDNGYEGLEIRGSHIVAKQLMPRLDVKAMRTKQARAKRLEGQ